jgi:hypothetical protein
MDEEAPNHLRWRLENARRSIAMEPRNATVPVDRELMLDMIAAVSVALETS